MMALPPSMIPTIANALEKAKRFETDPRLKNLGICMVKTHLSLSHDPSLKGRPRDFVLPIRDIMVYEGAGFIVPIAGDIKLMPGTASNPAYRRSVVVFVRPYWSARALTVSQHGVVSRASAVNRLPQNISPAPVKLASAWSFS